MELWDQQSSPWTVEDYLRRTRLRMSIHQEINEDLSDEQRVMLGEEATRYEAPVTALRTGARALEDFEDIDLLESRERINVRDAIVDTAQDEAWKIVGLREPILAPAGQDRKKVFKTSRVTTIKNASREVTVQSAQDVAANIRALPAFEERDRLAERLEVRGTAMANDISALGGVEERFSVLRLELQRIMDAQRVEIVRTYGRLLTVLPKSAVESLFPRPRRKRNDSR